jgi:hypothetical protein
VNVGDTYADLGANVDDDHGNLGIHLYVDGVPADAVQLDTSTAGQHTINYVATDTAGNTATSTRTVIVSEPQAANDNAPNSATTAEQPPTPQPGPTTPDPANDNPPPGELPATGT